MALGCKRSLVFGYSDAPGTKPPITPFDYMQSHAAIYRISVMGHNTAPGRPAPTSHSPELGGARLFDTATPLGAHAPTKELLRAAERIESARGRFSPSTPASLLDDVEAAISSPSIRGDRALTKFALSIPIDDAHKLTSAEMIALEYVAKRVELSETILEFAHNTRLATVVVSKLLQHQPEVFWKLADAFENRAGSLLGSERRNFIDAIKQSTETDKRILTTQELRYLSGTVTKIENRILRDNGEHARASRSINPDLCTAAELILRSAELGSDSIRGAATDWIVQNIASPVSIIRSAFLERAAELPDLRVKTLLIKLANQQGDSQGPLTAASDIFRAQVIASDKRWWPDRLVTNESAASLSTKASLLEYRAQIEFRLPPEHIRMCREIVERSAYHPEDEQHRRAAESAFRALTVTAKSSEPAIARPAQDALHSILEHHKELGLSETASIDQGTPSATGIPPLRAAS